MKEYEPSREFVARVMRAVETMAASENRVQAAALNLGALPAGRALLAVGGAMLGILNLLRLWLTVLSPALCQ